MMRRVLRQFGEDTRGVAAVEFALILPLLVLLYFGTVEASALYTVDRRVATVSSTMADLVSRENGCITNATLQSYFNAATGIMRPYSTTGLKQIVSLLSVNEDGDVSVEWSQAYGDDAQPRATGDTDTLANSTRDPNINALARIKGWLVSAEISYPYTPLFGMVIKQVTLANTQYFLPRFQSEIQFKATSCD
jgi:Flp pilus assembly protein TadG